MLTRARSLGLAAAVLAVLLAAPAGGGERRPAQATGGFTVKTFNLPGEFVAPWQLTWIADGTNDGAIAFTDRSANAIGILDPGTGSTQRFPLSVITSPNGIVPIDFTRFAVAGTGGIAIFDRSGAGRITQLAMAGTRNFVIATDSTNRLFVPDFANNDLRIIRPPYGGPADITKFALPAGCRGPTGVIPRTAAITILCQTTNNIVDLSPTGTLLRTTALPIANMGAQELRPGPRGGVFSGFSADRLTGWVSDYPDPYDFINVLLDGRRGPAVPTVGYFNEPAFQDRIATAARFLGQGRRPPVSSSYNAFAPSFRGDGFSIGTFPTGRSLGNNVLRARSLVGSALGPNGSILVADATPGRPAIHRVTPNLFGKTGQGRVRFRYPVTRLTAVDKDFLVRMTYPFFGPGPSPRSTPTELQVGIVGSSSSPWHVSPTFGANFKFSVAATGARAGGGTYRARVQSADTGAFTRVLRITNLRADTRSVTLTAKGTTQVPVTFGVYAQTPKPEPCECKELFTRVVGASELDVSRSGLRMDVVVTSILTCTNGSSSSGCKARLEFSPTLGDRADGLRIEEGDATASCAAPCGNDNSQSHRVTLVGGANFGSQRLGRSVRVISLEIEQECAGKTRSRVVDFVFRENGTIDYRRSDINGNGIPDEEDSR